MSVRSPRSLSEDIDRVYRDHESRLRDMAARAGRAEAADLVHDAVVKTLEAGKRITILDPVRFVFQVTRNTLMDRFRSRARRGRVVESGLEESSAIDQGAGPERTVIASERLKLVLAIIDCMPPRRREAFLLCRMEELTYAQASRRMGVSMRAVEKHIASAMEQLSKELEGKS